ALSLLGTKNLHFAWAPFPRFSAVESTLDEANGTRTYRVVGQVFFNSADKFVSAFDFREAVDKVAIDLHRAHFWDITSVSALDKVVIKFRRDGADVELIGLNEASATIIDRFGIHDKPEEIEKIIGGH
ncbi:MAG: STAS domain-containing protein, partial [Gammaproteobacteria bacterium]